MSADWIVTLAGLALTGATVAIVEWRFRRSMHWTNIAHRQRMEMIDHMASSSDGIDGFNEMVAAMETVGLREHAEALSKGKKASEIYPAVLWGPAKAVEGVD